MTAISSNTTEVQTALKQTMNDLMSALSAMDEAELNQQPASGGWSAGQTAVHLLKAYGVVETLNGGTKPPDRPIDRAVEQSKAMMLNFDIKMKSPESIVPPAEPVQKTALLASLQKRIDQLIEIAATKDLSLTCTDFAIPGFGEFTRLEWIWFNIFHTQRHIRQIKSIQA
jgi:hypothetical protein